MTHFLEIRDLSIQAGTLELHIPYLRLEQGKTHCLIGRSGSGKSLLASSLAGVRIPGVESGGEVLLNGSQPTRPLWKEHVFLLPQEPGLALDPTMPVGDQINEVLKWRRSPDAQWTDAGALAGDVGLTEADLRKLPGALSGGMQQRVMIAMALVAKAAFVVADEPTKGLDTRNKARVIELFKTLKHLGRGLLIITHDLEVARSVTDTVSVIDKGQIVEQGATARLLERPRNAVTRRLVENEPARWPLGTGAAPPDGAPVVRLQDVSFDFAPRRPLIRNVSLEIHRGEIVGLFGASGAGKSTLGDLCLALNKPVHGRIDWHGNPAMRRVVKQHRSRFQKLFQNPVTAFPPNLKLATVFNSLTPGSEKAPPLPELLNDLDLDGELLDRQPGQLSGGELQRLAIVRVLMAQPDFIVCDEPSSRLDAYIQRQALDAIASYVRGRHAGALLISHDLDILCKRADRIFELTDVGALAPLLPETRDRAA